MARAVYSNADIYMFDDPLSAVDAHVSKSLFDLVIGPNGMLKNKTRLLVTNSLNVLPLVDEVIMLENGCIVETGSYELLINKHDGKLAELMKKYLEINGGIEKKNESESSLEPISVVEEPIDSHIEEKYLNVTPKRKLVEDEKSENGSIKFSNILEYFKACRLWLTAVYLAFYLCSYVAFTLNRYWLKDWSNDKSRISSKFVNGTIITVTTEPGYTKFFRLNVYIALGLANVSLEFISELIFVSMLVKATKRFHNRMLYCVLRSGLKFFESTPTGRIINRKKNKISFFLSEIKTFGLTIFKVLQFKFLLVEAYVMIDPGNILRIIKRKFG
jgi:ATP-binding cassette, subfamily C (CFTR/MRP), member 1